MGKKSQALNTARAEELLLARAPLTLEKLTQVLDKIFGTEPRDVEAAALFVASAAHLGYTVAPQPVSIFAYSGATGAGTVVGAKATAYAKSIGATVGDDTALNKNGWGDAGHVLVALENPAMVFDPTFKQFSRVGLPDFSLAGQVETVSPEDGVWEFEDPDTDTVIRYFLDDSDQTWRPAFDALVETFQPTAVGIAKHIRNGGTALNMRLEGAAKAA
jgi:hypothetical protein